MKHRPMTLQAFGWTCADTVSFCMLQNYVDPDAFSSYIKAKHDLLLIQYTFSYNRNVPFKNLLKVTVLFQWYERLLEDLTMRRDHGCFEGVWMLANERPWMLPGFPLGLWDTALHSHRKVCWIARVGSSLQRSRGKLLPLGASQMLYGSYVGILNLGTHNKYGRKSRF